jgi:hypothetical protein
MPEQAPSTPTRWSERNFNHPLFNHQQETKQTKPPPQTMRSSSSERSANRRRQHEQHTNTYWAYPAPPHQYMQQPYYYEPPRSSSFGAGWVIAIFALMIVFALGLATCGGCVMLAAVSGEDPSLQPDPAFTPPDDPNSDPNGQQKPKAPAPTAPTPKQQPK